MILEYTGAFPYIELPSTDENDMLDLYLKHVSLSTENIYGQCGMTDKFAEN